MDEREGSADGTIHAKLKGGPLENLIAQTTVSKGCEELMGVVHGGYNNIKMAFTGATLRDPM